MYQGSPLHMKKGSPLLPIPFAHCHAPCTGITLLPKEIFPPSIQHKIGLPRKSPPLISVISTLFYNHTLPIWHRIYHPKYIILKFQTYLPVTILFNLFKYLWNNLKQFYFHKTWYRIIYKLHWNIIHKSKEVTWNVGPHKLMRLPGHPNLNLNLT